MPEKKEKKPYAKPAIVSQGSVEKITLTKQYGDSDAMLFQGPSSGLVAS